MFVCLSVCLFVPYGRPNGWADRDETWHTHSCPPREFFWQGQCQGHSRMPARVTEVWTTRSAARISHLANSPPAGSGLRQRRHLANDYETLSNYTARVTYEGTQARRRRRRAVSGAAMSRTPSGGRVIRASIMIIKTFIIHHIRRHGWTIVQWCDWRTAADRQRTWNSKTTSQMQPIFSDIKQKDVRQDTQPHLQLPVQFWSL